MRFLTSSHVNSLYNSLRTITCSRETDSNLKMYSMKVNTIYQSHKWLQLKVTLNRNVSQISCSYSIQVLVLGTCSCIPTMIKRTTFLVLLSNMDFLREKRA